MSDKQIKRLVLAVEYVDGTLEPSEASSFDVMESFRILTEARAKAEREAYLANRSANNMKHILLDAKKHTDQLMGDDEL